MGVVKADKPGGWLLSAGLDWERGAQVGSCHRIHAEVEHGGWKGMTLETFKRERESPLLGYDRRKKP